jgi:hypothetical protein
MDHGMAIDLLVASMTRGVTVTSHEA